MKHLHADPDNTKSWQLTDPACCQYCFVIEPGNVYRYRELTPEYRSLVNQMDCAMILDLYIHNQAMWHDEEIDLSDYTAEQQRYYVEAYYDGEELERILKEEPQIVAECIFEQTSGQY